MGTYYDSAGRMYADIKLSWDANTELDVNPCGRYVVQWSRDGTDWQSTEVPGDTTSCKITGLATGVAYYFRVRAEDKAGNASENWTYFNSGNPIAMSQDADPPADTSSTLSTNSLRRAVEVLWDKPSDPDYEYAELYRNSSAGWDGSETKVGEGTDRAVDEIGTLVASFYYSIKLYDHDGNCTTGANWVLGSTDTENPDPPTNLSVSDGTLVDAAGHVITWMEVSLDYPSPVGDVEGFEIQVCFDIDGDGDWSDEQADTWTLKVQSGEISGAIKRLGVPGNVDYRVRARSEDDAGLTSTWTSYVTGTTAKDNTGPSDPTNYSVEAGKKKIIVSFDEPPEDDWQVVEIHASTSGSGFTPSSSNLVAEVRSTRHTYDTPDYSTYHVKIRLRDTSGNYNPSGYVYAGSATPSKTDDTDVDDAGLSAPKILISGSVNLSDWIYPGSAEMDGADIYANSILMTEINGDLDDIDDGGTYGKVLLTCMTAGRILLAECSGDLDDVADGGTYGRVLMTDISAGHIKLSECVGDSDDIPEGSSNFYAGASGADFRKALDDLDDIANGSTYGKVLLTNISAGRIILVECTGDLDDIDDGSTYQKVRGTDISSGHIKLCSYTVVDGEWYDESGVEMDANHGINIYGTENALTTRATKTGTIQCYVGSNGAIYAGAGNVSLDSNGITLVHNGGAFGSSAAINWKSGGTTYCSIYSSDGPSGGEGNLNLRAGNGSSKTINLIIGTTTMLACHDGGVHTDAITLCKGITVSDGEATPTSYCIHVKEYITSLGGIWVGQNSDPGTDNLRVDGEVRVGTELFIGGTGTAPSVPLEARVSYSGNFGYFHNDGGTSSHGGITMDCGQDSNPTCDYFIFRDGNGTTVGNITGNGSGGVNYSSSSDLRIKDVIGDLLISDALTALLTVNPISYRPKGGGVEKHGFGAQHLAPVTKGVVTYCEDVDRYVMDYGRLTPYLWRGWQYHQQVIEGLKEEIIRLGGDPQRLALRH